MNKPGREEGLLLPQSDPMGAAGDRGGNTRPIAPAWHTLLLIAVLVAVSVIGKFQLAKMHGTPNRLSTYATTAGMELAIAGWVAFGLRLRRVPFRSLFGAIEKGNRRLALDLAIAAGFWIGALVVLGAAGLVWTGVEAAISQAHAPAGENRTAQFSPRNQETLRTLEELAPATKTEVGCWILLCCFAGTIEELVFRGYLQRQFTAWGKGRVAWGVVGSSLLFGAAHGYQGARNMALLAVFGALFSGLVIVRRSLRAGMIAHSWHDLIAGLTLAILRAHHLL